jgi:hypothetical protein
MLSKPLVPIIPYEQDQNKLIISQAVLSRRQLATDDLFRHSQGAGQYVLPIYTPHTPITSIGVTFTVFSEVDTIRYDAGKYET